jgi:hypothetical protein
MNKLFKNEQTQPTPPKGTQANGIYVYRYAPFDQYEYQSE